MKNFMSKQALALWESSNSELKSLMESSQKPEKEYLAGSEFMGLNVGFITKVIKRTKFIKSFYMNAGELMGNNFMVEQNDPAGHYHKLNNDGRPKAEGYFLVESNPAWNHYSDTAFLDYGKGGNKWYQPVKLLRDYLNMVMVYSSPDILLGHAYLALGLKVSVGFFVLERIKEVK